MLDVCLSVGIMSAYDQGFTMGQYRREHDNYDSRMDFAQAAKEGTFKEFKRGFEDGFDGKDASP